MSLVDTLNADNPEIDEHQIEVIINESQSEGILVTLNGTDITPHIINQDTNNPYNLSQFVNLNKTDVEIDKEKASEFLDDFIYELLPNQTTRQERINNFFKEYEILKGLIPNYNEDDRGNLSVPSTYTLGHDITAAQDDMNATIDEEESFITRLT